MKRNNKEKLLTGVILLLCSVVTLSCRDHFDIDKLQNPSKIVIYCFPTTEDTTFISVTTSVGVKKLTDTHQIRLLSDARITYTVNGEPREVQPAEEGIFFVVGRQQVGDRITIRAEHDDYATAEASTTIPEAVAIELQKVVASKEYDPDYYEARDFNKLLATFTDPATSEDYYAVRVGVKKYKGRGIGTFKGEEGGESTWYCPNYDIYKKWQRQYPEAEWSYTLTDSVIVWPQVVTNNEPLLNPLSNIDYDFGFSNDYYDGFYIFSDKEINGQTYTLHLNISIYTDEEKFNWGDDRYQVILYRISPEFYHFMKSYNDVANNELAQGGLSQIAPTITNIRGGFGLLGSYAAWPSNWRKKDE